MIVTGHGVDVMEVERIRRAADRFGERFLLRVFAPTEIAQAERLGNPWQFYASRFAAKEAFSKALGTGFVGFGLRDVMVVRNAGKPPHFEFSEKLSRNFPGLKPGHFLLSLSHVRAVAVASVIRVAPDQG